jgi:hypothetical protein
LSVTPLARNTGFRLAAGAVTVAAFLVIGLAGGEGFNPNSLPDFLMWFLAPGAVAGLAGWRRDRVAARLIYVGGIVGATAVAWAAGAIGVEPGADPAMRSSYYMMLIVIAAGVSAVVGVAVVAAGYWLGHRLATKINRG